MRNDFLCLWLEIWAISSDRANSPYKGPTQVGAVFKRSSLIRPRGVKERVVSNFIMGLFVFSEHNSFSMTAEKK